MRLAYLLSIGVLCIATWSFEVRADSSKQAYESQFADMSDDSIFIFPAGLNHDDVIKSPTDLPTNGLRKFIRQVEKRKLNQNRALNRFKFAVSKAQWVPQARKNITGQSGCAAADLEKLIMETMDDYRLQGEEIQSFFDRCKRSMVGMSSGRYKSILRLALIRYKMMNHPGIRSVLIQLPGGSVVRGLLALKPDARKRPLVIVKCGIMCNVDDAESLRFMLMHLYDESPFNILAVGNISGSDYQKDNGHFAMGGFFEGIQLIDLANWLRSSTLKDKISSLHVLAVSLGGHGALYSSLYNSYIGNTPEDRPIQSVVALCPVVDLAASMDYLYRRGNPLKQKTFRLLSWRQMTKLLSYIPFLEGFAAQEEKRTTEVLINAMIYGAIDYFKQHSVLYPNWLPKPFEAVSVKTETDYWRINNFLNFADLVKTPTYVIGSADDAVVPSHLNAFRLNSAAVENKHIQLLKLNKGSHCAYSVTHGWNNMSTLYRSLILAHSPNFYQQVATQEASLSLSLNRREQSRLKLRSGEKYLTPYWSALPGKTYANLYFPIYTPKTSFDGSTCTYQDAKTRPRWCSRGVRVPFSFDHFGDVGIQPPSNYTEAQAVTRWLNANVSLVNDDGISIQDDALSRVMMKWPSIF